jgi:hypothetical protein
MGVGAAKAYISGIGPRWSVAMSYPVIVDSYMIDSLKRKARAARLQACRASPTLEIQLRSLADHYEADIERIEGMLAEE